MQEWLQKKILCEHEWIISFYFDEDNVRAEYTYSNEYSGEQMVLKKNNEIVLSKIGINGQNSMLLLITILPLLAYTIIIF